MLKAHASVYHLYKDNFAKLYNGKIGITLNSIFAYPTKDDANIVDRAMQFRFGWFAHPIFSAKGGHPSIMTTTIASNSIREGRSWSRLPAFSPSWRDRILGAADFLGLNYYTSRMVELAAKPGDPSPSFERDESINMTVKAEWKKGKSSWMYSVPEGLGNLLR